MIDVHEGWKFQSIEPITKDELGSSYVELNSAMKEQNEYITKNKPILRSLKSVLLELEQNFEDVPEHHELIALISNMITNLSTYLEIVGMNKKLVRKEINKIPSNERKQAQYDIKKETHGTHKCGGVCGRQIPAFNKVCSRSKCKASASTGKTKSKK